MTVHDCRPCRWWVPDSPNDEADSAWGACTHPLIHMRTMAKGSGCSYSFEAERRVNERRSLRLPCMSASGAEHVWGTGQGVQYD